MFGLVKTKGWYVAAQLLGWAVYCLFTVVWNSYGPRDEGFDPVHLKRVVNVYLIGLFVSHLLRNFIVRHDWLQMGIGQVLPRLIFGSLVMGVLAVCLQILVHDIFFDELPNILSHGREVILSISLNWSVLLLLWSLFYFAYHYFSLSRVQEIRNLRLVTSMREIELSNLRNQLNPHFMFNAMNSIRALVDEDPKRAKKAITELSSILRNSLLAGRKRIITLEEELEVVEAYLDLEMIRYDERLCVHKQIDPAAMKCMIPPMMLQTLVENAVKHGISRLTQGGDLNIMANVVANELHIKIQNAGTYAPGNGSVTGIGLRNTRKRLNLLFGGAAELKIYNTDEVVVTRIRIPILTEHESINS